MSNVEATVCFCLKFQVRTTSVYFLFQNKNSLKSVIVTFSFIILILFSIKFLFLTHSVNSISMYVCLNFNSMSRFHFTGIRSLLTLVLLY